MSVLLDVRTVDLPRRREAWDEAITHVCGKFLIHFGLPAEELVGRIDIRKVGGLACAQLAMNTKSARRTEREIPPSRFVALVIQEGGSSRLAQAGNEVDLCKGQIALIDSSRPCTFRPSRDCIHLVAHLPWTLVESRMGYRQLPLATVITGGSAAIAAGFARAIFDNADDCRGDQQLPLEDTLTSLILASIFGDPCAKERRTLGGITVLTTIQDFIEQHLACSYLTAPLIAEKHGISLRHLHRLFSVTGSTLGGWIRKRRLSKCVKDLENTALQHVSLTTIAHRWGFCDSAHFSRVFRAEFRQSPSQYRHSACKPSLSIAQANLPPGHFGSN